MPITYKDPYSGAIIFNLTPEEQETQNLKVELQQMKDELTLKMSELDALIAQAKLTV